MTYMTLRRPDWNRFRFYSPFFTGREVPVATPRFEWAPAVDIAETDTGFEMRVELPGVAEEDLQISVKEGALTLSGEKRHTEKEDTHTYRRMERRYGTFERRFKLPPNVEADAITAVFKDGVLTLSIPKPEAPKPTEIPITPAS